MPASRVGSAIPPTTPTAFAWPRLALALPIVGVAAVLVRLVEPPPPKKARATAKLAEGAAGVPSSDELEDPPSHPAMLSARPRTRQPDRRIALVIAGRR